VSNQVKLFIIDFNDFDIDDLAFKLQGFGVELDSNSKTYKEKLFSQFIRYKVLKDFLKLSKIEFSINQNNKPYLESHSYTYFIISHTKNHIVMTVADEEIGVDIEEIVSKKSFMSIAGRYFSDCEVAELERSADLEKDFYTLWTLKESQVKRSSLGIAYGLKDALFYKKDGRWISEDLEKDFESYLFENSVISICSKGVGLHEPKIFRIKSGFGFEPIHHHKRQHYSYLLNVSKSMNISGG
jgi:4'-phosphopantetheinyl transferase